VPTRARNVRAGLESSTVVVAVDVARNTVARSVTDDQRHRLLGPVDFARTRTGPGSTVVRIAGLVPAAVVVKVDIEAAGEYQPLMRPRRGRQAGSYWS